MITQDLCCLCGSELPEGTIGRHNPAPLDQLPNQCCAPCNRDVTNVRIIELQVASLREEAEAVAEEAYRSPLGQKYAELQASIELLKEQRREIERSYRQPCEPELAEMADKVTQGLRKRLSAAKARLAE